MNLSPLTVTLASRRRALARQRQCRFVELREFAELAVSLRKMERADDLPCRVRGLVDLETGERYFIEEEKLGWA